MDTRGDALDIPPGDAHPVVDAATALGPMLRGLGESIDADRRLPDQVIDAIRDIGGLRLIQPVELGGCGLEPVAFFDVIHALAVADASTAWVTFITNGTKFITLSRISAEGADRILSKGADTVVAGVTSSREAVAERVAGGYNVRGRWAYASGCLHADWLLASALITSNGQPETGPDGAPARRMFVVPVEEATILDTWNPIGLRGTGSNDFELPSVLVSEQMTWSFADPVQPDFPAVGLDRGAASATAVGVGSACLEEFREISKRSRGGATGGIVLADQDIVRYRLAEAAGLVGSGRAYVRQTMHQLHCKVQAGTVPPPADMAELDLSMQVAIWNAVRSVDSLCEVAGGPSIHKGHRLERLFRDIHAAANNAANSPTRLGAIGGSLVAQPESSVAFP